ncbi:Hypothetical Protein FCC1311_028582 [Hondaea fermentalgiana]|uniref:Uncharacterized protein n=1 Tax=Hondaea fermentalgiana TaxID=2315210 RepID=A0A2R5G6F3_9STRA|nr:Hypothetical Protein FCC1311_028582 [Hondaea fermentalgiana]|eukprot:GBG26637.1 Hypothetical Protein FCC1311_028582 [Hondaea fermentalgiana]
MNRYWRKITPKCSRLHARKTDDGCNGVERCRVFAEQTNENIDNGGFLTCWMSNLDRQDETSFAGVVLCQRIRSPLAALQPLALFMATTFVLIVLCIRAKGRKDRVSPLLNRGTEKHSLEHQTPRESMNEKDEHASAAKHDALFDETFWA